MLSNVTTIAIKVFTFATMPVSMFGMFRSIDELTKKYSGYNRVGPELRLIIFGTMFGTASYVFTRDRLM